MSGALLGNVCSATDPDQTTPVAVSVMPLDSRATITSSSLKKSGAGEWISPIVTAPFPFDELIYSWNVRLPKEQGFRIYLKAGFAAGDQTEWLYAGYWGKVKDPVAGRKKPVFDRGEVDMDWMKLKEKARSYQFKVVDDSTAPLTALPTLTILTTDNHPTPELAKRFAGAAVSTANTTRILDLPFRRQMNSSGVITPTRCQSAALATAMQYFGTSVPLELVVDQIYDPEYDYPGLWPRIVAAAQVFGLDSYIDRFRDWDRVRAALAENKVILCSIRLKKGECKWPPYEEMGNHIVALNGVTADGRVVVTDSFLAKSGRGYRCQWQMEDFEKIWMKTKNGVALVICPPSGCRQQTISELPPFPEGRVPITGDDH